MRKYSTQSTHPRDQDLVSVTARVRNSGVRKKFFENILTVGGLHLFTLSLTTGALPEPLTTCKEH